MPPGPKNTAHPAPVVLALLPGRSNAPYLVPVTLRFMAAELGLEINELASILNANTERVYGSWAEGFSA